MESLATPLSWLFYGFYNLKMHSFDDFFEFWKEKEVAWSQIRLVWWLVQPSDVIFGQKFTDIQGIVCWSIVMTEEPGAFFPQISSFFLN